MTISVTDENWDLFDLNGFPLEFEWKLTNYIYKTIIYIKKEIFGEIENYRKVAEKYKKAQTATYYVAVSLGSLSAAHSASGNALSLTGHGIIVDTHC